MMAASREELLDGIIDTALNYRTYTGGHLQFIVVPRADFLRLIKERDARRRCAAVLKKTHKELKKQLRFNSWGKDRSGRWTNDNGSLLQDQTRAELLSILEAKMNGDSG